MTGPLLDLVERWRSEALLYRHRGLESLADMVDSFAAELEERLTEWRLEAITLEQAVAETGYAYDTLQRKVGSTLRNAGRKGSPRVRRCDLFPGLLSSGLRLHEVNGDVADEELDSRTRLAYLSDRSKIVEHGQET